MELRLSLPAEGRDYDARLTEIERLVALLPGIPDLSRRLDDIETRLLFPGLSSREFAGEIADLQLLGAILDRPGAGDPHIVGATRYWASTSSVADDDTISLPTITANSAGHGFIHVSAAGVIDESAEFEIDSTGTAALIRGTANVVVNADTDTKLCIGTAAAQNPMTLRNRLGGPKTIMAKLWYN